MSELDDLVRAAREAPIYQPRQRKSPMLGIVFAGLACIGLAAAVWHLAGDRYESVQARELVRDFERDQSGAEAKYKGRILEVKGVVTATEEGRMWIDNGVVARVHGAHSGWEGKTVVVRGKCQGRRLVLVEMSDGKIVGAP
jgi:hypothetical protein